MVIIGGKSHPKLTRYIAGTLGCECLVANTQKFADQELKVQINRDLYERDVIIV